MAMTTLDPHTALIVIDMQRGIALRDNLAPHPASEIIDRAGRLVDRFRKYGRLVVLVNVDAVPPGRTDRNAGAPKGTIIEGVDRVHRRVRTRTNRSGGDQALAECIRRYRPR